MNHQNSQFDHDFYASNQESQVQESGAATYEYVFSTGTSQSLPPQPSQKREKNGRRGILVALTFLLAMSLCFAAGFGGAYTARQLNQNDTKRKAEPEVSPYGSAGDEVFTVSQVAQQVADSVVVINTSGGSGSGVVISAEGYILTCHHVVENSTTITVTLNSGSQYEAVLVGSDADSDLAVLRIQPKDDEPLTYAEQGSSADLAVGERVVAIDNPLGMLGGTVTDGIISAKERNIQTSDGTVMTLLQTNAAINSGNSGGGLFNLDGKLIGIVNAKYASAGVEGLAFAIPIDSAYTVQLDLIQYGYVRGVADHSLETVDVTNANLFNYYRRYGITEIGVYVISSEYTDEIKNADRVVSVNNVEVTVTAQIKNVVAQCKVGDTITIVLNRNGTLHTVNLVLREYVPDSIKTES